MTEESETWAAPAPIDSGGRVELRLAPELSQDCRFVYQARWSFDGAIVLGRAELTLSAAPQSGAHVELQADHLPDWLATFTETLLRTIARGAMASGIEPRIRALPRRLTRWRAAPGEPR